LWSPDASHLAVLTGDPWAGVSTGSVRNVTDCRVRVYQVPTMTAVVDEPIGCYSYIEPRASWAADGQTLYIDYLDVGP